jgi:glyoxylase-like metal-dependent hydrolase (beta-lactamase superfamily II)
MEIAEGVHQLGNSFVNIYLIVESIGLTLVDTGLPKTGPKIVLGTLQRLGYKTADLKTILITHADPDHIGGAAELKKATGARILASPLDGEAMRFGKAGRDPKGSAGMLIRALTPLFGKITPQAPDEVLKDAQELPILGGLRVVATPGHTPGHLAFYSASKGILFVGDALRSGKKGLDFGKGPFTWDYEQGVGSVKKLAALGAKIVCCGHGPILKDTVTFPFS